MSTFKVCKNHHPPPTTDSNQQLSTPSAVKKKQPPGGPLKNSQRPAMPLAPPTTDSIRASVASIGRWAKKNGGVSSADFKPPEKNGGFSKGIFPHIKMPLIQVKEFLIGICPQNDEIDIHLSMFIMK